MRIKDDVVARIGLGTLTQAVHCTQASRASVKAVVIRGWVPADRGNSSGGLGGGACTSSGGGWGRTLGLVVDG